jgi:hypothetical protein
LCNGKKTPTCESLDPVTKPTIIATKTIASRSCVMEKKPKLVKV